MTIGYIPFLTCEVCFSQLLPVDISIDWPTDHLHWADVDEPHIWVTLECQCYWKNCAIEYMTHTDDKLYPKAMYHELL